MEERGRWRRVISISTAGSLLSPRQSVSRIYEEFRSMLGVHDRNMFLPWYSDIARMMLRHELSDNPDKLYLIRSQADEWAIRVARRIMYRKITHFDLNAEPLLSEWKHLLRWARAVWECESNDKNEWFKIKMETK